MNSGQAIIPSEFLTGDEREVESAGIPLKRVLAISDRGFDMILTCGCIANAPSHC